MEVYLDNSATTRCFDEVAQLMHKIMCEDYGNPSSMHHKGVEAEQYLRYAKETLAGIMKVNEKEILSLEMSRKRKLLKRNAVLSAS